jgi:hypothetical protein
MQIASSAEAGAHGGNRHRDPTGRAIWQMTGVFAELARSFIIDAPAPA